jgi:transcriptional regulator with XRE-family HTH domain
VDNTGREQSGPGLPLTSNNQLTMAHHPETKNVVPFDEDLSRAATKGTDVDRYVGSRIRERRVMLGLSQQQMAHLIGVTYQQAHKYERGINRISAGRLFEIARVLRVPVSYFFEGLEGNGSEDDLSIRQRMCLELARNFTQIPNERHREALSQLARVLAAR